MSLSFNLVCVLIPTPSHICRREPWVARALAAAMPSRTAFGSQSSSVTSNGKVGAAVGLSADRAGRPTAHWRQTRPTSFW